jgi:hypothetical protein
VAAIASKAAGVIAMRIIGVTIGRGPVAGLSPPVEGLEGAVDHGRRPRRPRRHVGLDDLVAGRAVVAAGKRIAAADASLAE